MYNNFQQPPDYQSQPNNNFQQPPDYESTITTNVSDNDPRNITNISTNAPATTA
jgi:hypothetical protein